MEIEKKVLRFLELSNKFSQDEDYAIGEEKGLLNRFKKQIYWDISHSGEIKISGSSTSRQGQVVEESLEVLAERMITKIREFEEYKQLQKELTDYFNAKQKLTK